jgi:hypothetical protein
MKTGRFILLSALLCVLFLSCRKGPGPGGKNEIKGKVLVHQYNSNFSAKVSEYYAQAEDVYIVYGDDDYFADKIETHYDGTFSFPDLLKGEYTIYIYSKDSSFNDPSGEIIREIRVNLEGRKEVVDLGDIVILDN